MNTKFFYLVVTMMFLVACNIDDNKNIAVTDVSLDPAALTLITGDMETLKIIVQPFDATNQVITWTSNNEEVVTIDKDGNVTAVSPGTAIITATTQDGGKTANCTVTVLPDEDEDNSIVVTGISLEPDMLTLTTGEVESLTAAVQPNDATNQTVTWSSNNEGVATVDEDGNVTAVTPGTAIITATTQDGNHTATCTVVVIELVVIQSGKVDVDNRFAFSMFKEVSAMNGPNTFFSPLSLNLALGMLYNGASGNTRVEMAKVLGMGNFTQTEVNEYYRNISQTLLKIDPLTDIRIANSIWYHHTFPVKQTFIDFNRQYFDATVHALDFNNPDAADAINKWCDEKTNGKIKEIVKPPLSGDLLHLINALYFKSKWVYMFDKADTRTEDFIMAGNQMKKVNMMRQDLELPYYMDQYLRCVELPYGNRAFSMVAILPNDSDIEQLIAYLDNEKLQKIIKNLIIRDIPLRLPRFKVECTLPLNEPVKNTGMKLIFEGGFLNMSDIMSLVVSNIRQKTYIEVNEEGTEAAAVTDISVTGQAPPFHFVANRPFLYLIMEKSSGAILFIGRMDDPVE